MLIKRRKIKSTVEYLYNVKNTKAAVSMNEVATWINKKKISRACYALKKASCSRMHTVQQQVHTFNTIQSNRIHCNAHSTHHAQKGKTTDSNPIYCFLIHAYVKAVEKLAWWRWCCGTAG